MVDFCRPGHIYFFWRVGMKFSFIEICTQAFFSTCYTYNTDYAPWDQWNDCSELIRQRCCWEKFQQVCYRDDYRWSNSIRRFAVIILPYHPFWSSSLPQVVLGNIEIHTFCWSYIIHVIYHNVHWYIVIVTWRLHLVTSYRTQ